MFKRIFLASLVFMSQINSMNFSIDLTQYVEKIATKISTMSTGGKIIGGCVVIGAVATGMYMRGKKDEKLPFAEKYPNAPHTYKKPKRHKGEDLPRDKRNGDYIDDLGNGWRWDPIKNEWDVQVDPDQNGNGRSHINVSETGEETHKSKKCAIGSVESYQERERNNMEEFTRKVNETNSQAQQVQNITTQNMHQLDTEKIILGTQTINDDKGCLTQ